MKKAIVHFSDGSPPQPMDAAGYFSLRKSGNDNIDSCTCQKCGQSVHLNDRDGAAGFALVDAEITKRGGAVKLPGFSHYPGNNEIKCEFYKNNDLQYAERSDGKKHHVKQIECNKAILAQKNVITANEAIKKILIHGMIGDAEPSAQLLQEWKKSDKESLHKIGFDQHPYLPPFMAAASLSAQPRIIDGAEYLVQFQGTGWQKLSVTRYDGKKRELAIPSSLILCYAECGINEPVFIEGRSIQFPVTRDFAHDIAVADKMRRKGERLLTQLGQGVGKMKQLNLL